MYSRLQLVSRFIRHYFQASNGRGHGMHSPFVFDYITRVMNDHRVYPAYEQVETLRSRLQADSTMILVEDYGAGSAKDRAAERSIASIARNAAKPLKWGQLLYRMVQYYKPSTILELGSSLGITSAYLALGNPGAKVHTFEGAGAVAGIARENFRSLHLNNVNLHLGNFDDTLPAILNQIPPPDFCFIDGNHRRDPTERYFHQLLPLAHNDTMLVFDDIHWSRGMEEAWSTICNHDRVQCSIDLFYIGIVLFRKEFREKQHFRIRF